MSTYKSLPNKLTLLKPPSGIVFFRKGQYGYKRATSIRLKANKRGDIYFVTKGNKFVQDKKNERIFIKIVK